MHSYLDRPRGWAFLLPLAAISWVNMTAEEARPTGTDLLVVSVVCGAAGVAWQGLNRRDLTDRLTFVASYVIVMAAVFGLFGTSRVSVFGTEVVVGLSAVLAGCVYTEQWWRRRDARRAALPVGAPTVSDAVSGD